MAAPTRYGGASFSAGAFASSTGGTVDIGNDPDTVVIIHGGEHNTGAGTTITGCTVNGAAATLVKSGTRPSVGGDVATYVITSDSAIGSGNVTVTLSMSNGDKRPGCIVEVWHGCTGSPRYSVGTEQTLASGSGTKAAGPYTSDTDSKALVFVSTEASITITATSPTSLGANTNAGVQAVEACVYKDGATSVTLNWTHNFTVGNYIVPVFVHAAAAPSGYTLTCAQGSYTVTGQTAGTKAGRKLALAQGSYTLSGSTASLLEGRNIACAQGSYTLTGSTAYADYAITCAAGSYTLSGQAAALRAARLLALAQGAYTLTGQDVALLYTTPGAYSIAMGQGSYALTGQSAALQAARRIVAEQGLYALSGQAAALRIARQMALAAGSYSLTGQDAAFDAPASLTAAYGSYALTGQAVTLTYGGTPAPTVLSAPPSGRRLQGYGRPANIQRSTR